MNVNNFSLLNAHEGYPKANTKDYQMQAITEN